MEAESSGSTDLLRIPVSLLEYPGMRSEIVIDDDGILLVVQNPRPYIPLPLVEVRLSFSNFVGRQGRKLQFRSGFFNVSASSVDFAGMSGNAWFHATCDDEASAVTIAERIEQLLKARHKLLVEYFQTLFPE